MSNQPAVIGPDGVARPYIGGQALIEGVMMRSPHAFAAVLRRRNGELLVRAEPMLDARRGRRAWPFVRGVFALVEALRLGSRTLRFSADVYERDLADAEAEKPPAPAGPSLLSLLSLPVIALVTSNGDAPLGSRGKSGQGWLTLFSVVFALGLFVALPQAFAEGTSRVFGLDLDVRSPAFQGLTGAAKIAIVVGYMLLIRRIPEIHRVFQYHGAEHKAIYTYESGEELSVENAKKKTTLHPRCGTTFIVMVALVSIFVFAAIGPLLPAIGHGKLVDNVVFFLMKLPFLPLIAAITFELQRLLARHAKTPLRALLWPGFLVQRITTIEPDDSQLEVALGSLAITLGRERAAKASPAAVEPAGEVGYAGYPELLAASS